MSTLYLSRPVFEFDVNWAEVPKQRFTYKLNERTLAFALPRYERLQKHTQQGIEFTMTLLDEDAVGDWDDFTAELQGRLGGFWFPSPFHALEITEDASTTTQFTIKHQHLKDYLADHPSTHLAFTKPDGTRIYANIAEDGVALTFDGKERITLSAAIGEAPQASWTCQKLIYVRLLEDNEDAEILNDGVQLRMVQVVELPLEYTDIETGQLPVYLYDFTILTDGVTTHWRYTGLNQDIVSGGQTFTSNAIEHGSWVRSLNASESSFELRMMYDEPLKRFVPFKIATTVWVQVTEISYANPDIGRIVFTGKVLEVKAKGQFLTAKCATFLDVLGRKFPRFVMMPRCNYHVYDPNCRASVIEVGGNILTVNERSIEVDLSSPPIPGNSDSATMNYWALGFCYLGTGATRQVRSIRQNDALVRYATGPDKFKMRIRTDEPFEGDILGHVLQLVLGCNGSKADCQDKHNNFVNYGGHDYVPTENPSVVALQASAPSGNKK